MYKKKRLPIGKQTFRDIRDPKENYVYIDKTRDALNMIEDGSNYYFLSRPRRFGKSLFLDTLSEIFLGHKQHFEGLHIYDKYDWSESYPVIKIDFTGGGLSNTILIENSIRETLIANCKQYDINFERDIENIDVGSMLKRLINILYEKYNQKVVLLIDEYDKPIIDNITDKETALEARNILRGFYASIKACDQYLRFVFMTGVSKFSKLNLFSGLNNIQDITLNEKYATITGYTHNDLKESFTDYLEGIDLEKVKQWYNGYNYFGEPIYNPFDILLFLSENGKFSNYWWKTGNPKFLIDILKNNKYYLPNLENITVSEETLESFDVEHINIVALLWQTGYLTFDKEVGDENFLLYKMKIPNLEIQKSLNALFFDYLSNMSTQKTTHQLKIHNILKSKDFSSLETEIKSLFAAIPYQNYVNNNMGTYEGYYASVMYAFMASLGFLAYAEDTTNKGRADMTLIGPNEIVILEFKVDMPAEEALHQIKTKRYYEKYLNHGKQIYFVGMHFSSDEKNVVSMVWERFED